MTSATHPQSIRKSGKLWPAQKKRVRAGLLCGRQWVECHYCGEHLTAKTMTLDHIKPVARGGGKEQSNFVPACRTCNLMKADIPYRDFIRQVARIANSVRAAA